MPGTVLKRRHLIIGLAALSVLAAGAGLYEWRQSFPVWVKSLSKGRELLWSGKSPQHFMAVFDEGDDMLAVFVKHHHRDARVPRFSYVDGTGKSVQDEDRNLQVHDDGARVERLSGYSVPVRRGYQGSIRILFEEQTLPQTANRDQSYKKGSGVIDLDRPLERQFDVQVTWPGSGTPAREQEN